MVRGWVSSPDGRHHGAHYAEAAKNLGRRSDGFLDFSQNVNPLGPPEAALIAGAEAFLRGEVERYPNLHYPELRAALASYLEISPKMVLPTNGGAEALFMAARAAAVGSIGSKAIILEPTFSEYVAATRAAGLEVVRLVVRSPKTGFRLEFAALDEMLKGLHNVSVVFLCNPNNPTGDVLPREEVLWAAKRIREAGAVLVVDEAFADFAPQASVVSEVDEALFVARSFTKFFAIPGLRLGCLIARDPEHIQVFQPSWSVNAVAAAAGIAAAKEAGFVRASFAEVTRSRQELLSALERLPGVTVYPGAANFLLVQGPEGLPERLAKKGILVRGCEPFLGLGPGFFRVAVRRKEENERLVEALHDLLFGEAS
jgi:L-threonine-O-3-phosphate decarboxylase